MAELEDAVVIINSEEQHIDGQFLNDSRQPLMLFRCTKRCYAEEFIEGKLFFNTPGNWIQEEIAGNKGRGDMLEGIFCSVPINHKEEKFERLKSDSQIEVVESEGFIYFRRKKIRNVFCLCFYGLSSDKFRENLDSSGKIHLKMNIPKSYFCDFSEGLTEEKYAQINDEEKPVVLLINNWNRLIEQITHALGLLGVKKNEMIVSPVTYLDKRTTVPIVCDFPEELLLKDSYFENQSEVRIIISSESSVFLDYMQEHHNKLEIGSLKGISKIKDYYFEDMEIQRIGKRKLLCSIPQPRFKKIKDMSMDELYLLYTLLDRGFMNGSHGESKEESLQNLSECIFKRFGVHFWGSEGKYMISGDIPKKIEPFMDNFKNTSRLIDEFHEKILHLNAEGNYLGALLHCKEAGKTKELRDFACIEALEILKSIKNEKLFFQVCDYCLDNDIQSAGVLSIRSSVYGEMMEYQKAIDDLRQCQNIIGYNYILSSNLGIYLIYLGKYPEAIESFSMAIKLNQMDAFSYYNRGVAYFKYNNLEKAKEDMEQALKLLPEDQAYIEGYRRLLNKIKERNSGGK